MKYTHHTPEEGVLHLHSGSPSSVLIYINKWLLASLLLKIEGKFGVVVGVSSFTDIHTKVRVTFRGPIVFEI